MGFQMGNLMVNMMDIVMDKRLRVMIAVSLELEREVG